MSQPDEKQTPANPEGNNSPSHDPMNARNVQTRNGGTNGGQDNIDASAPRSLRSVFNLELFFDFLLIVVTAVYVFFAYHQWKAIEKQGELMSQQLAAFKDSSAQSERLIRANEELTKQNAELVKHSGEQAKASLAQAEATKTSAQIAQQSFYIGDRPYLSANAVLDKFEPGTVPSIGLIIENNGKTPALDYQVGAMVEVGNSPKPDLRRAFTAEAIAENIKQLPYSKLAPKGNRGFLTAGGKSAMEIRGPQVTPNLIDDIKSQRKFMFVWGLAVYKDGLNKRHGLKFCFFLQRHG